MNRRTTIFPAAISLVLAIGPVLADGSDTGKALHDENCTLCHDGNMYTRAEHRMKSMEQLRHQVELCQGDVGADWSAAQIQQVVEYLNHTYYKFQ